MCATAPLVRLGQPHMHLVWQWIRTPIKEGEFTFLINVAIQKDIIPVKGISFRNLCMTLRAICACSSNIICVKWLLFAKEEEGQKWLFTAYATVWTLDSPTCSAPGGCGGRTCSSVSQLKSQAKNKPGYSWTSLRLACTYADQHCTFNEYKEHNIW
jgi:hypothetical protein